ncbi:flavodoxin family protein [Marimonas sp. MJW-29]|uniref:Flavodoxin family protein n=1 Tax=Sulfitobacter sediminis TaxID=3234186 RepID=A0ABV3RL20_9RHOB
MKSLILYFSLTGTTATLAQALAEALDADIAEITCARYAPGGFSFWRYLKAGRDSLRGHLPPVDVPEIALSDYDLVVLGAPIWTSYPAVPLRAYLSSQPKLPSRIAAFFTSGGDAAAEKAAEMVSNAAGKPLAATLTVQQRKVLAGDFTEPVKAFAARLKADAQ